MVAPGVLVLHSDGSELYDLDYFDGMKAEDIQNMLKDDGYKGYLRLQGGRRQSPGMPLTPGATYIFVEEQPMDDAWYLKHDMLPTPFQVANSVSAMVSAFGTEEPVYDMGRTSASAVPLPLACESFRCYLQQRVPDVFDWSFLYKAMDMSNFFPDERQRQVAFSSILQQYLMGKMPGIIFEVKLSPVVGSEPDIRVEALIMGEWILVLLVEIKPELGLRGEPSVEVMSYYANHFIARRSAFHWTFFYSCCPVLIIEVVGPNIRVSGAAFFDKPAHEPFTPYLHIHKFLQDGDHLQRLCKALASIGPAICSLVGFYSRVGCLRQQQQQRQGKVRDLSISWPDLIRDEHVQGASVTQYSRPKVQASQLRQQHAGREKLLLFSLLRPASARMVKFCQRYGVEVHRKWAELGHAPPFTCKQLDGNWLAVDMEYYRERDGWRSLKALDPLLFDSHAPDTFNMYRLPDSEWEVCKAAVKSAYIAVSSAHPQFVHGDLRRQNILYNVSTGKVAFIDFDRAGVDGQDLYPLFINPLVRWPEGVGSCQPMRSSHDVAALKMELGLNLFAYHIKTLNTKPTDCMSSDMY